MFINMITIFLLHSKWSEVILSDYIVSIHTAHSNTSLARTHTFSQLFPHHFQISPTFPGFPHFQIVSTLKNMTITQRTLMTNLINRQMPLFSDKNNNTSFKAIHSTYKDYIWHSHLEDNAFSAAISALNNNSAFNKVSNNHCNNPHWIQ